MVEEYNTDYGKAYISKIRSRLLHQNKNWLAIVCGDTGSGKSYSAMSLADMICPRGITVKRNLIFTPKQFMEKLVNKTDLEKGDILVFDEAGVGMSARDWYSMQNKLLGQVLQTFRHLNVGVIFTVPNLSFIDVQARKLFHSYFETATIDYKNKLAILRAYNIQTNSRYNKSYFKNPRFRDKNGRVVVCKQLFVPKPKDSLIFHYERIKQEFTKKLNEDALAEITASTLPQEEKKSVKQMADEIVKNPEKYTAEMHGKKYIDVNSVSAFYGLGRTSCYPVKRLAEHMLGWKQ